MVRLERIAGEPSGAPDVALARIAARERLGELAVLAGRTDTARKHFETARDSAAALATSGGGATADEAKRLRALSLDKLGDLSLSAARVDEARASFHEALALRESMSDSYRNGSDGRRGRAVSENKLGDLAMHSAHFDDARAAYQRGLALIENDQDPDAQRHRFDLRFTHARLGDVATLQFNLENADRAYRRALEFAEQQVTAEPSDVKAAPRSASVLFRKSAVPRSDERTPRAPSNSTESTWPDPKRSPLPVRTTSRPAVT